MSTPFIHLKSIIQNVFQLIVRQWTLSTEDNNLADYMLYLNYLTTPAAFSALFLSHLNREMNVSANSGCDIQIQQQLSELKKEIENQVCIPKVVFVPPSINVPPLASVHAAPNSYPLNMSYWKNIKAARSADIST